MPRPPDLPDGWIYAQVSADDRAAPTCDFCTADYPTWLYPCEPFTVAVIANGQTHAQDSGDDGWAACDPCAALVDAGDRDGLMDRLLAQSPPDPRDLALVRATLAVFQGNFFLHRTAGPPARIAQEAPKP